MLVARCVRPILVHTLALAALLTSTGAPLAASELAVRAIVKPQSAIVPVAVFGTDERSDLPTRYLSLKRHIGILRLNGTSICSAFCVAEDAIATAGHCLFGTAEAKGPDAAKLEFALDAGGATQTSRLAGDDAGDVRARAVAGTRRLRVTPPIDAANDWAIAQLSNPICHAGGLTITQLPRRALDERAKKGDVYQIAMHRDLSASALRYGGPCAIASSFAAADMATINQDFADASGVLLHTCDTGAGSSGSPLLVDGPGGPEVVGINVGTYVLSHSDAQTSSVASDKRAAPSPIANTAVFAGRFRSAVDALGVVTGTIGKPDQRAKGF